MFDEFFQYLEAERRYSPKTVAIYRYDLDRFANFIAKSLDHKIEPLRDLNPRLVSSEDIRLFVIYLKQDQNNSAATINRALSTLRSYFKWLRRGGEIDVDPMLRVRALKTEKKLPNFISETKMADILSQLKLKVVEASSENSLQIHRDVIIFLFFYSTGVRRAELANLTLGDFEYDYKAVRIRGKGDKVRVVPLLEAMRDNIYRYIERLKRENIWKSEDKYLFLTKKGRRLTEYEIYNVINGLLKEVGVQGKRSPHLLRHTFATHLLNGGADMREIQELLGHSSLTATQIYTHNSISEMKRIYKKAHPRGVNNKK